MPVLDRPRVLRAAAAVLWSAPVEPVLVPGAPICVRSTGTSWARGGLFSAVFQKVCRLEEPAFFLGRGVCPVESGRLPAAAGGVVAGACGAGDLVEPSGWAGDC